MIKSIFPVNILVKDLDMSDEFCEELNVAVNTIIESVSAEKGLTKDEIGDNEFPVFTEENIKVFPQLAVLRELMIDGFYELSQSYENEDTITREDLAKMVQANVARAPVMQKGSYKRLHNHTGAIAFAVYYLSDVDNNKHGGKLILKDPTFNSNYIFRPGQDHEIETKKNRLVVAPAYIWHEVTPYIGDEDRVTVVINLDYSRV